MANRTKGVFKRIGAGLKRFFFPPVGSPRWLIVLPYLVVAVIFIALVSGGIYGWNYTNSSGFCGYTCHTMPPQNATYLKSPHANVDCTECHIGRSVLGTQFARKTEDLYEVYPWCSIYIPSPSRPAGPARLP